MTNNIFYSTNAITSVIFKHATNSNDPVAEVLCNNNTIYNLHKGSYTGLIHFNYAKSLTFKNNIVEFGTVTSNEYVTRCVNGTPSYDYSNNHYWCHADDVESVTNFAAIREYGTKTITPGEASIISSTYPFASSIPGAGAQR